MSATSLECLNEEQLLLRARMADPTAKNLLCIRMYQRRKALMRLACPDYWGALDEGEQNDLFFRVYLACEGSYRFGHQSFVSYLILLLQREITKVAVKKFKMEASLQILNLDYEMIQGNGSYTMLADIIPSTSPMDNPDTFLTYAETLILFNKLPKGFSRKSIELIQLMKDGYSLEEGCGQLGLSKMEAKSMLVKYRAWARKVYTRINKFSTETPPDDVSKS